MAYPSSLKSKWLVFIPLLLLPLLAFACGGDATPEPVPTVAEQPTAAPEPTAAPTKPEFRLKAVGWTRVVPQFDVWEWWANEIQQRTNGRVRVDLISLPELGLTGFEMTRVLKAGLLDVGEVLPAYISGDVPLPEGVELPGIYPNWDEAQGGHRAWYTVLKGMEQELGGTFIGAFLYPPLVVYGGKPVRNLEDLKGMKIRVFGTAQADYLKGLGAVPVSLPFAEVYTALERGTVDAAVVGPVPAHSAKWYEVSDYMVDLQLGPATTAVVVSQKTWEKLPPDIQQVLKDVGSELTDRAFELALRLNDEGITMNQDVGIEWLPTKEEWLPVFQETVQNNVVPNWVSRSGTEGKDAFNKVLSPYTGFTIP